jgi:hypothetical protein
MTAMTKFAIGGAITVVGLVLMTMANRQMIAEWGCVGCDDEDTVYAAPLCPGDGAHRMPWQHELGSFDDCLACIEARALRPVEPDDEEKVSEASADIVEEAEND